MRTIQILGGIALICFGTLLLIPLILTVWPSIIGPATGGAPGTLPNLNSQYYMISAISIGNVTLAGWKMWAFLGGLAAAGVAVVFYGIFLLVSRRTNR